MPDRAEIVAIAAEAMRLADGLASHIDERFRRQPEHRNGELVASLIGLDALLAMVALADHGVDDQIGILGRSLTERAIDLQYLRTPTTRKVGHRQVFLRTIDKEELFLSALVVTEERIRGEAFSVPASELERAKDLRQQLGITGACIYWHCASGLGKIVEELHAVLTDPVDREALKDLHHMFKLFSLHTHTVPMFAARFDQASSDGWPWKVKQSHYSDETFAGCVLLAMHVLRLWSLAVEHDITDSAIGLLQRLRSGDFAA